MATGLGWFVIFIVSAIVALALVLRPNVHVGEARGSNAMFIALTVIGALGFLQIAAQLLLRWLMSSTLG